MVDSLSIINIAVVTVADDDITCDIMAVSLVRNYITYDFSVVRINREYCYNDS